MDEVKVTPWTREEEPGETAVRRLLAEEGLSPYRWSNGPGDVYQAHTHSYHKVIYVVQGDIEFGLPDLDRTVSLSLGDRLDLPPHIAHDAVVGPQGVVCLEAHRR